MDLGKEYNYLYMDVVDAYWSIGNIRFDTLNDTTVCLFDFTCFPSRDSKQRNGESIQPLSFGASERYKVDGCLYRYAGEVTALTLFPNGIPLDVSIQKHVIYEYLKIYLGLTNYTDVLEE